jgi:hypothetical protein
MIMDIRKIFGLFSNDPKEEQIFENLETFKTSPYFKLGMFEKLIINGLNYKKKIVGFFNASSEDLDLDDVAAAGEFIMYNRGWFWISQMIIDDEEWEYNLKQLSSPEFITAIKLSICYFEWIEEFEKCSFLKQIENKVQKYLD